MRTKYVLLSLTLWFLVAFSSNLAKTFSPSGATDFHSYWYSGLFVREGINPYRAYFTSLTPATPIYFVDSGWSYKESVEQPGLGLCPANTAPVVLLLSLLSYFTWPTAKLLWTLCNLLLMSVIPFLALKLLPGDVAFTGVEKVIIYVGFWSLAQTRSVINGGQTSFLVFVLMLIVLLYDNKPWIAGVSLGVALSKYSLSLPLLPILLYRKKYRILAMGLATQLFGVVVMSWIDGTRLWEIFESYLQMLRLHNNLGGMHLPSLFPPSLSVIITIILSITVLGLLANWLFVAGRAYGRFDEGKRKFVEFQILNILILWILLATYHRYYDGFMVLLFFLAVWYGLKNKEWDISHIEKRILVTLATGLFCLFALFPGIGPIVAVFPALQNDANRLFQAAFSIPFLIALFLSLWLLYRQDMKTSHSDGA